MLNEKKIAINLLTDGISLDISFHKALLILSKYYKYLGTNKDSTRELLIQWLKKQKCTISFEKVVEDLDRVVKDVYDKNYKLFCDFNINITDREIEEVKKLKSRGDKLIGFTLICLSKIYGEKFYCYHYTLHKITNMSVRQIKRIIKRLTDSEFITIVSKDITKKIIENKDNKNKRYSHPNKYNINVTPGGSVVFKLEDLNDIISVFDKYILGM